MEFLVLSASLKDAAISSVKYFRQNFGYTSFVAEQSINDDINFRPTLQAKESTDKNLICVEVVEKLRFTESILSFILECRSGGFPIKIYIAFPKSDANDTSFLSQLKLAQKHCVGVVEISDDGVGRVIHSPIPQSLAGLRTIQIKDYPPKYRGNLNQAVETFKNGDPASGCHIVYKEIENLTRRIIKKVESKGLWKTNVIGTKPPDFDHSGWAWVCEFLVNNLDFRNPDVTPLEKSTINLIAGITSDRNETGHKPATLNKLKTRDLQLRSRFENAADLLKKLIDQNKNLKA